MIINRKKLAITYEEIKVPVFNAIITICSTPDIENCKNFFKFNLKAGTDLVENEAVSIHIGQGKYMLVFNEKLSNSYVVHEIIHLVNFLYKDYGIELDINNDENYAYQCKWFFEKIENFIKRIE